MYVTKRIDVIITGKKVIEFNQYIRYVYTFSGTNEYKENIFYDSSARVATLYNEGQKVSLYINPENVEQFWFEEEDTPSKDTVFLAVILILVAVLIAVRAISKW